MDVGSLNTFFGGWGGGGMILSKKTKIGIEFNYSNQAPKKWGGCKRNHKPYVFDYKKL
jgi:hypothetical protein